MHISIKVEKCLVEVISEEHTKVLADPAYRSLPSRKIRAEVIERLKQKYPKQNLKVALGTVQLRIQRIFGSELYEQHYSATIAESADQFLRTQAEQIKEGAKDPNYIAPKIKELIAACKVETSYSVSISTVHNRFQELLGQDLYTILYPKRGNPIDPRVETFLEDKIKTLQETDISIAHLTTIEEIRDECLLVTGLSVSNPTVVELLNTRLGKDTYFQIITQKSAPISEVEQKTIGEWWVTQADLMLNGHIAEVETITAYKDQIKRDYATIRKYGETALENKYGEVKGHQIYSDLTRIQKENSILGFLNHQLLERAFQQGIAAMRQEQGNLPEMFRETHLQPNNRCDIILPDIYRDKFLEECLKQLVDPNQTVGDVLALPPQAASWYVDEVIDFSTRFGQAVLKEKAKYCDGKTLVILGCTGDFPPGVIAIRNPNHPDIVEIPVMIVAQMFHLPEVYLHQIEKIQKLAVERDVDALQNLMSAEQERHPNEIDWETKKYQDYVMRRDKVERSAAEQAALKARQREKGQNTIDGFLKGQSHADLSLDPEHAKDSETARGTEKRCLPSRLVQEDKKVALVPTLDRHKAREPQVPLTGKVDEDWFLQILSRPVDRREKISTTLQVKSNVDSFFETARDRMSFHRQDLKEAAAQERIKEQQQRTENKRDIAWESGDQQKGRIIQVVCLIEKGRVGNISTLFR